MQSQEYIDEELESLFPAECHFKIIVEDLEGVHGAVEHVLKGVGIIEPLELGNLSAQGKYKTLNVSAKIETREEMFRIDNALRAVKGVRMVL